MHPVLIQGLPVQTFGLCVALGVLAAWTLAERLSGRSDMGNLIVLLAFAGIAGARLAHVVEFWHEDGFDRDFLSVFAVWRGGIVFYGGFASGAAALLAWCAAKRENVVSLMDVLAPAVALGHAFGRIGCFFHGCCWGRPSESFLAVRFPAGCPAYHAHPAFRGAAESVPLLPAQLFESAALFVLAAVLVAVYRRRRAHTAGLYMLAYGFVRFGIEFLRDDERPSAFGLSSAQLFSVAVAAAGAALLAYGLLRHEGDTRSNRR